MEAKMSNKVPQIRFNGYSDAWVQHEFVKMVDRVSESSTAELPRVEFEDLISGMGRLNKDVTKPGDTRSGIHFVAGDVLYGKLRPYLNNWLHATFEGLALGDFWVFRTKEMLEPSFLYALIQAPKYQQTANLSSGTKMPRSDWKTVSTTEFCVPEKQEQQKIGELFNNLDNLIAANQRKLDLLKEQKKGYLQKMFPKNGAKVPELRFAGFADDWEERKFKDILKTYSFRSYLANASDHGKYEVIQQGDNPLVGYSDGIPFMDYKDIILFGDHTVSLYKPQSPFFISTDGVKILSADNFEGNYLYTTLERYKPDSQGYKRHFTILKNQELWFTRNVEEQQKVGSFFKQLDNNIALQQKKISLLKDQKKGLLQKMFI